MKRITFSFVYILLVVLTVALLWVAFTDPPQTSPDFKVWTRIYLLGAAVADWTQGGVSVLLDDQIIRLHILTAAFLTAIAVPVIALVRTVAANRVEELR